MPAHIFNFLISLAGLNRKKLLEISGGDIMGVDCSADIL